MASITSFGQTKLKKNLSRDDIGTMCRTMSDEYRSNILNKIPPPINEEFDKATSHWFPAYLNEAYNSTDIPEIHINEMRLNEHKLLRIAEGKFRIEEGDGYMKGEKYRIPAEMSETEYFFLNGKLIKIVITKGETDYNALPQNYWITMRQLDLIYEEDKLIKKTAYFYLDQWYPSAKRDDWIESFIKYNNINVDILIERAYFLMNELVN